MGGCMAKSDGEQKGRERSDSMGGIEGALGKQVIDQIKRIGESRQTSIKTFDAIAMRFRKIEKGFVCIRKIFERMDADNSGFVSYQEFKDVVKSLSLDEAFMMKLFEYGDKDEKARDLDFKSFVLAFASLYLLLIDDKKEQIGELTEDSEDIKSCFDSVIDSFLFLDTDNDGHITEDEIKEHLGEGAKSTASGNQVIHERFKEMCARSKNNLVSFKHFLFAVETWVGIDEGE